MHNQRLKGGGHTGMAGVLETGALIRPVHTRGSYLTPLAVAITTY
jgi:hypothetical protein